ncbi:MAG: hypothetical protein LBH42_08145, partial [Treponema sp.]|nr:hypothetical protein [Treponema sp.]
MRNKNKLWLVAAIMAIFGLVTATQAVSQESAGGSHGMAVRNGSLFTWGSNNLGQLGNGTATGSVNTPTRVGTVTTWRSVSSGGGGAGWTYDGHSVAIQSNGSLWAWGNHTGNNKITTSDTTGTVTSPTRIGTDSNWATVSAGSTYTLALKSDGSLWSWGADANGRTGLGKSGNESYTLTPARIGNDSDWVFISAGNSQSHAIKRNGTLWGWGSGTSGQLGDGTETSRTSPVQIGRDTDWASVSGGDFFTVAIKTNGTLWAWGGNGHSQLGNGETTQQNSPIRVGTDTNWKSVSAGGNSSGRFAVAIKTDGSLWTWGNNLSGRTGQGTTDGNTPAPKRIGTDTNWATVSAGSNFVIAAKTDGTTWGWGSGTSGRLGRGSSSDSNVPIQISGLPAASPTSAAAAPAASSAPTGTYAFTSLDSWRFTLQNGNFTMTIPASVAPNRVDTTVTGSYTVSGNNLILNRGTQEFMRFAITNATTLTEPDGSVWRAVLANAGLTLTV